MRFAAISLLVFLLLMNSGLAQPVEITCSCADPPGGSGRCEASQVAICKIVNKRCSAECRTYSASSTSEELVVQLLRDTLGMSAQEIGLTAEGRRTSETRSEASLQLLRSLFVGQRGPVQYEAAVPNALRNQKTPLPDTVQLGLPPEIVNKLKGAKFGF